MLALHYLQAGLSLIPIRPDGSKEPAIRWKAYQSRQPTPEEVRSWVRQGYGLAILGGAISGNLEILDFDAPQVFALWCELVEELAPGLVQRLPTVQTPTNGRHLYYRCEVVSGNTKLAPPDARGKARESPD